MTEHITRSQAVNDVAAREELEAFNPYAQNRRPLAHSLDPPRRTVIQKKNRGKKFAFIENLANFNAVCGICLHKPSNLRKEFFCFIFHP